MSLRIDSIEGALRKAAETADSRKGEANAFNEVLDRDEIPVFIKAGVDNGCSMEDILEVATKVVPKDDPYIKNTMEKFEEYKKASENAKPEMDELKQKISKLDKQIQKKEAEKEKIFPSKTTSINFGALCGTAGAVLGGLLGGCAGFVVGSPLIGIADKLKKMKKWPCTQNRLLGTVVALMAIGAGYGAYALSNSWGNKENTGIMTTIENYPGSYEEKVKYNKAEKLQDEQITPLKHKRDSINNVFREKDWDLRQKERDIFKEAMPPED